MPAGGVLATGNLVADLLVRPVAEIPWDRTALVDAIEQHTGGNGANTAFTLATLGTRVRLIGSIGRDAFGDFIQQRLDAAGVDTSGLRRCDNPTAVTNVLVHADGRRGFLHRLGASAVLSLSAEEFARELDGGFRHYHLASPFVLPKLRPMLPELLRMAKAAGLTTSVDANWDALERWLADLGPCLPYTDILFANRDEARLLAGTGDPGEAARALRKLGARMVVVKLGERGCLMACKDGEIATPAWAVDAIDTTGAGDCFVGGFLSEWLRGGPLPACSRFANAVAALSTRRLGGTAALLSRAETEAWMRTARAI